ncbi:hypothetical protein [Nakamurella deserti]|uniref:hypothetical protein n=1 Tax=Nakamurella deserti TaxID=2164074 RepID=UPI000DBE1351|nr:hypothetical protein [Nakamurella deserti]
MRWDDLFDSLDRQFEELLDAAEDAEQADRARVAFGAVPAVERLVGALGSTVRLRLAGDRQVTGVLDRVGPDFVLLRESAGVDLLVAWSAVAWVEGLSRRTGPGLGTVDGRLDLRKAVRSVARDRAAVTVHTTHGTDLSGTIDRVGADFFELAAHAAWETRRSGAVQGVVLVPLAAVLVIRSAPLG